MNIRYGIRVKRGTKFIVEAIDYPLPGNLFVRFAKMSDILPDIGFGQTPELGVPMECFAHTRKKKRKVTLEKEAL